MSTGSIKQHLSGKIMTLYKGVQYMCVHLWYSNQISHARFWQFTTYHLQTKTKAARSLFYNLQEFDVHVTMHHDKFLIIKPTRCTNFSNLIWNEILHVSDSFSVHHQEFFIVHTAVVYVTQFCWQLASKIRMELHYYQQIKGVTGHEVNTKFWQEKQMELGTQYQKPIFPYKLIKAL
jgi:hypothetical protein